MARLEPWKRGMARLEPWEGGVAGNKQWEQEIVDESGTKKKNDTHMYILIYPMTLRVTPPPCLRVIASAAAIT